MSVSECSSTKRIQQILNNKGGKAAIYFMNRTGPTKEMLQVATKGAKQMNIPLIFVIFDEHKDIVQAYKGKVKQAGTTISVKGTWDNVTCVSVGIKQEDIRKALYHTYNEN